MKYLMHWSTIYKYFIKTGLIRAIGTDACILFSFLYIKKIVAFINWDMINTQI